MVALFLTTFSWDHFCKGYEDYQNKHFFSHFIILLGIIKNVTWNQIIRETFFIEIIHILFFLSPGDLGGNMGLLLGLSALSIFEILDLIIYNSFRKCVAFIRSKKEGTPGKDLEGAINVFLSKFAPHFWTDLGKKDYHSTLKDLDNINIAFFTCPRSTAARKLQIIYYYIFVKIQR